MRIVENVKNTWASLVIDSSALLNICFANHSIQVQLQNAIGEAALIAPNLLEYEFYAGIKKKYLQGKISRAQKEYYLSWFDEFQIKLVSTRTLSRKIMHISETTSAYDAAFVALAIELKVPLLTSDAKLAKTSIAGYESIFVAGDAKT